MSTTLDGTTLSGERLELFLRMLEEEGIGGGPAVDAIARRADASEAPASFAQRRLWFVDRMEPGSPAYNVPVAYRLRGALDVEALGRALAALVERHEALRTTFAERHGEPVQVIAPAAPVPLPVDDLSALADDAREAEAHRRAADEAAAPFDLAAGPLFRARLLRLGEADHVLLLTLHHVIADGWSLGIVFRELAALYDAHRLGIAPALDPLAVQYGDYAAWQRERASSGDAREALEWWRAALAGAPPLELPADRGRPAAVSGRGARAYRAIPPSLADAVKAMARREGTTPFAVLLSAFAILAQRHAREDDVVVGMAVAGRGRRELEALAGNFVNLLALRIDLSGDPAVRELVARVSGVVRESLAREEVPFDRLVEVLHPDRALGRTPLVQVVFGYQDAADRAFSLAGVEAWPLRVEAVATHFDLTLNLIDDGGAMRAECLYAADLFSPGFVDGLLARYETLLAALVADPGRRASRLPMLTPHERVALVALGAAEREAGPAECLHAGFESWARRAPHAFALTCEGAHLTYAQVDARADRLARRLRARGVGPEARVGLCLERSAELVIAILGVLKAGGAYVPLDPAYPAERLSYVLDDAGVRVLVAHDPLRGSLPSPGAEVICIDRDDDPAELPELDPARGASPDNAAYVIYTSGSTGRPKGCVVTHANVHRLFTATDGWFGFGPGDVWTLFHSCAFDFSVWEIWGALLHGGRLVVVPLAVARDPAAFHALLERERVTVLSQTPGAFRQLARVDGEASARGEARDLALRYVVFGGEALEPATLRGWVARRGDRAPRLVNMYGITETTVHVTWRAVTRAEVEGAAPSLIGRPLPDLSLHLLDARGEPVPAGVPGELYVGGAGVSRGYPGRPALTALRFVPDPFSRVAGARLYRSGDLARRRDDGDLEYLGRADHQVKVRGFRIEPGEVEAALAAHPAVREAVVLALDAAGGDRVLAAFVAPRAAHAAPTVEGLRAFLGARLPEHMVPATFTVVEALPLTPNGKVDRRALAALADAEHAMAREAGFVAPRTPTEAALAEVWREVLGLERVGVHDNFFALGGDSIRSIRVVALARERGLPFPLAHVFRYQTVAELAAELGGGETADDAYRPTAPFSLIGEEDRARLPDDVEDAYPLARLQAGMLYHAALAPDEPVYHNVDSFRLDAPLDPALLREAVRRAVARHPILRTGFRMEGFGEPLQLVHRHAEMEVGVTDLAHLPADAQERELAAYRDAELARRFDLARPPLLRFHAHRLSERAFQLTLTECHAILDGWSLTSTLAEIFSCYAALLRGEAPPEAPPLPVTYRDFVAMERRALASEAARSFWEARLAGFAPQRLPRLPRPDDAAPGRRVESRTLRFGDEVLRGLREVERAEGIPLKSLLLAAHLKVLAALHGAREVATGFPCNGRPEVDGGEQVRGLFLNTVPFRLEVPAGSWIDLARAALEAERELLPYRRYPMAALQDGRGGEPLFETAFNYVHFHRLGDFLKTGQVETGGDITERADTSFTLVAAFGIGMVYGGLRLILACDAAELSAGQIDAIEGMYHRAVAAIAAEPRARHDAAPLLEPGALAAALRAGTGDPADPPRRLLHRAPAVNPDADPETALAPVLLNGGEPLARAALDRRANRLARHLLARGVGAGARVAVCLERSVERTVALLAVLKTGATVLPLDPAESAARLSATARAAGASLAIGRADVAERCGVADAVRLDREADEIAAREPEDPVIFVSTEAPACALPLRATGGGERIALLPHRAVAAAAAALARALELDETTTLAAAARPGTELEVLETFAALLARAPLHLAPREADASPAALAEFLRRSGARAAALEPRTLAALRPEDVPGLAAVAAYGGSCPPAVAAAWAPGRRLVVAFGGAEGGLLSAAHRVESPSLLRRPPVGAPAAGARVHVLDAALHPAPPGTPGEVCVGGAGLAHGYLGRPALTAERFVPDPFAAEPGARLFRTGQRGRRGAGGALELLDRPDRRVVILGHPVELDELEAALLLHPAVREAAVVSRDRGPGRRELVAHAAPAAAGADELRAWLEARFPAFLVPAAIHLHPSLPRTAAGEVDRDALAAAAAAVTRVLPDTAVERAVAEVWEEVLGAERVGVDDNFFDVGGNSLLVARVRTLLMERFGREVSLVELLRHSTIRAQAALLRDPGPPALDAAPVEALADRADERRAARRRRGQARGAAELPALEVEG